MFFPATHVQQVYIILRVVIIEIIYVIGAPSLWPLTPQVHPQRLLNSGPSTEVQTNRTPRGEKATSGNGQLERSPAYWCENDHYWGGKKRSDGVDWAADRVGGRRWQDKTPDQWLRQWDKHLLGHCAGNGGLDLTLLFPHCEQGWAVWGRTRGAKHLQWPVGVELWFPSLAHVITANLQKGGSMEPHLPNDFTLIPHMLKILSIFHVWFLKEL